MTVEDIARKLKLKDKHLLSTEKKFKVFMESYGKRYSTREEYLRRLGIFAENMVRAVEHQALDPTAVHGVTQFSDLSQEEFERFYTGAKGGFGFRNGFSAAGGEAPPLEVEGLPEEFDWREKGAVTEVKMQVCFEKCYFVIDHLISYHTIYLALDVRETQFKWGSHFTCLLRLRGELYQNNIIHVCCIGFYRCVYV